MFSRGRQRAHLTVRFEAFAGVKRDRRYVVIVYTQQECDKAVRTRPFDDGIDQRFTDALAALGTLDRVTRERLFAVLFDRIRSAGVQ